MSRGPGWVFGLGWVAGFSLAWRVGLEVQSVYISLRHPDSPNWDRGEAIAWLQDTLSRAGRIIFHHALYDLGWLSTEGITVDIEKCDDTQYASVMCDENRLSYSLDSICSWLGVRGKDERLLREAAAAYGYDPKKDLWRLPARHVGPYAQQDAVATLGCWEKLRAMLDEQELERAYRLEVRLIPMVIAMRRRGIRIDESAAEKAIVDLKRKRDDMLVSIGRQLGWGDFSMHHANSPAALERAFDEEGVPYPRTPKTKRGSFKSDWMKDADHWLPNQIATARQLHDMAEKFIGNYILGSLHQGRIHAEINQLRDDDSGTRSYRFSYSSPPLQQIPGRDPVFTRIIRGIFLPERDTLWGAADYSQQEPRMAVHMAAICDLPGSAEAVEYYLTRNDADFHTMVAELTGVPRKQAKIINLGLMYGMGLAKLAASLGVTLEEAKSIIEQYHARMPFVGALSDFCTKRANQRGFIRLLDGARCRFDQFEPSWREPDEEWSPALPLAAAEARWPGRRLRRAFTHKSMNRLIQGSSARQTKLAMLECFREGILPLLQMHDELDFPVPDEVTGLTAKSIMVEVVKLRVPMRVDMQYGGDWGEASIEPPKGEEPLSFTQVWRLAHAA